MLPSPVNEQPRTDTKPDLFETGRDAVGKQKSMRYLLAVVLPPLGMLSVGRPILAIVCLLLMLTLIAWPVASVWAVLVVNGAFADARTKKVIAASARQR